MKHCEPSIAYLELFAICAAIYSWTDKLRNLRVLLHCDNQAVVEMVNSMSSKCPQCMKLIRLITLMGLKLNSRFFAQCISTKKNLAADSLSRLQLEKFCRETRDRKMDENPTKICHSIWPVTKVWDMNFVKDVTRFLE